MMRSVQGRSLGVLGAVVLTLVAVSPRARANRAPSTNTELRRGQASFENGEFKKALTELRRALARSQTPTQTAQIHLLRGECYAAIGQDDEARRAFELALVQDPDIRLDPDRVAPGTVAMLDAVLSKLVAELHLQGQGGQVTLDGIALGPMPIQRPLSVGTHHIEVTNADASFDQKATLVAHPREHVELSFTLPAPSSPLPVKVAAPPVAPPQEVATAATSTSPASLDLFGQLGAIAEPGTQSMGFEAGAGVGHGVLYGSLSVLWGAAAGIEPRLGVREDALLGPVGGFACLEVPVFFASGAPIGLGLSAGVSGHLSLVEPYAAVGFQHFLSSGTRDFNANYFLMSLGARVHLW